MHFQTIDVPAMLNPVSIALLTKQINEAEAKGARFLVLQGGAEFFCKD